MLRCYPVETLYKCLISDRSTHDPDSPSKFHSAQTSKTSTPPLSSHHSLYLEYSMPSAQGTRGRETTKRHSSLRFPATYSTFADITHTEKNPPHLASAHEYYSIPSGLFVWNPLASIAGPLSLTRILTADEVKLENYECGRSLLKVLRGYRCRVGYLLRRRCPEDKATIRCRNSAARNVCANVRMFSRCYGVASFPSSIFPCTTFSICDIS